MAHLPAPSAHHFERMASMKSVSLTFLAILALGFTTIAHAVELPTTTLTIGTQKLTAELATTPAQRETGLMNRFSLKPDYGMLFVFERAEPLAFWMRNTYVPLSIAFISEDGTILNIEDMQPQTDDSHWSKGFALYTLEMKKGWFAERGIVAGQSVKGLPPASSKR
jgi:uncharacterized protein